MLFPIIVFQAYITNVVIKNQTKRTNSVITDDFSLSSLVNSDYCINYDDCKNAYLSKWYDKLTQVFLSAGETDVVVGDEHLSDHMHLSEGRPQSAVCVTIQPFILRQAEQSSVSLIFSSCVQVPKNKTTNNHSLLNTI